ncbi:hypothetical protein DSM112329_00828 [Paraconexibacter sp. AEG42_29]|uniref:Phospholipase/carboxylesterase/thioesterase domain-containing protein n=1 Tax=Paraconexibacter sp. AEG42_29 TaxID=2997339 RepID=A0AAU7AQT3_9ACTN
MSFVLAARTTRLTAVAVCAASAFTGLAAGAAHAGPAAKPDLSVARGNVTVSDGALSGSFVVKNSGRRAPASTAALKVRVNGRTVILARVSVPPVGSFGTKTVRVRGMTSVDAPGPGDLVVCADSGLRIRERSERNNCRVAGEVSVTREDEVIPPTTPAPAPAPAPTPAPAPKPMPAPSGSSVPTSPIAVEADTVVDRKTATGNYWLTVPQSYDASHKTPATLFVWMHGCGGQGAGDIYTISPMGAKQKYVALSLGGREDKCWDMNTDSKKVLEAIADVKTHLNINPRKVVLGGFSSGGDLAYRTAFYNSGLIAGVLAENTAPFQDTQSTQAASLAAATTKFRVVHLAHTEDDTYDIKQVRAETSALMAAGFPVQVIEKAGGHSDATTDRDLVAHLLPHLEDPWMFAGA